LAELPARVSQVLLAAKVAADEIVSRAMERADLLEQQAHEQRQAAIQQAQSLTRETVGRARRKAQALTDDARRKSEKMLADARAERDATLADLATRQAVLEGELQWAETKLLELQETSSAIAGMVDELFGRFADNPTTASRASSQLSRLRTAVQRRLREVS
jgi:cell division septum initiation protein DivIVA